MLETFKSRARLVGVLVVLLLATLYIMMFGLLDGLLYAGVVLGLTTVIMGVITWICNGKQD